MKKNLYKRSNFSIKKIKNYKIVNLSCLYFLINLKTKIETYFGSDPISKIKIIYGCRSSIMYILLTYFLM